MTDNLVNKEKSFRTAAYLGTSHTDFALQDIAGLEPLGESAVIHMSAALKLDEEPLGKGGFVRAWVRTVDPNGSFHWHSNANFFEADMSCEEWRRFETDITVPAGSTVNQIGFGVYPNMTATLCAAEYASFVSGGGGSMGVMARGDVELSRVDYVTEAELTTGVDSIRADVSETVSAVDAVAARTSSLEQNAQGFQASVREQLRVQGEVTQAVSAAMTFGTDGDGRAQVELSASGSTFRSTLTNEGETFYDGDARLLDIDGPSQRVTAANLWLGGFRLTAEGDHLLLDWMG